MYSQDKMQFNEQLIEKHAPLVKKIAYHLMARLPASVQVDDLIQAGLIGLIDAGKHYDMSQGAQFETYATIRVRGAMLDEVRRSDWVPKSVHKKARDLSAAIHYIEAKTGREAKDHEVAQHMQISLDEYHRILWENNSGKILNIDDLDSEDTIGMSLFEDKSANVVHSLITDEYREQLAKEISRLPEREKMVMSLYYDTELNLKEVGKLLDISESRVSQLLSQAQQRIKSRLSHE